MAKSREDISRELIRGASKSGNTYINVNREQLLIALGGAPEKEENEPAIIVPAEPETDV